MIRTKMGIHNFVLSCALLCALVYVQGELYIADYTQDNNVTEWSELSDTVRTEGKSKATLVSQDSKVFKRAILFTLLNPQPCGAGFAGVIKYVTLDLSPYTQLKLKVRGQGQYNGYKIVLRHRGEFGEMYPSYCHFFEAPKDNFDEVTLLLDDFKPYRRGKLLENNGMVLDKSNITTVGIQTYGGVYMPVKQAGVASLEIDWIKVV